MCIAYLHMPLREFYDHTPLEINYAFKAYNEREFDREKSAWERSRMQVYWTYLSVPSKNTKVSYEEFKRTYVPLGFDKDTMIEKPVIGEEVFAFADEFFKKVKGG